jgi:hypothetical protein
MLMTKLTTKGRTRSELHQNEHLHKALGTSSRPDSDVQRSLRSAQVSSVMPDNSVHDVLAYCE